MAIAAKPVPEADPVKTARSAGLRYMSDGKPGIRRERAGERFCYFGPDGKKITDAEKLAWIKSLAIPPAWTGVWISPVENGHLLATGRDAKGRKQYRYHPRWREVRDETKYSRTIAFAEALPKIRKRVEEDLARPGLPQEKVLATVVKLLEATLVRVGNEEYRKQNRSFGLTTMRTRHVEVSGHSLRFEFRGKGGKRHEVDVKDRKLAGVVRKCQELPGQELFQYLDADGKRHAIGSSDVNLYLREVTGQDFTAKDFRTWAGTVLAAIALRETDIADTDTAARKNIVAAIEEVARRLGNTPAICRKCYVHPVVLDAYLDGTLVETLRQRVGSESRGLDKVERQVMALLKRRLDKAA